MLAVYCSGGGGDAQYLLAQATSQKLNTCGRQATLYH